MSAVLFRILLLAGGLGLGEIGLTSLAGGESIWVGQLALALLLLIAGSAGLVGPLLGTAHREVSSRG